MLNEGGKVRRTPCIGVLALQGAFAAHVGAIHKMGWKAMEVRYPHQLESCDALILPGGESTTCHVQSQYLGFEESIRTYAAQRPVLGTCAGLIVLARWGILDVTIERNSYGRQSASFQCSLDLEGNAMTAICIRAPKIIRCGPAVHVLASHQASPMMIRQGMHLGTTWHPELNQDPIFYRYISTLWWSE